MTNRNAERKISWGTGIVYAVIVTVLTLGTRFAIWFFKIYNNQDLFPVYGDIDLLVNHMFSFIFWIGLILPVTYLICYRGYMRRAAVHVDDPRGVARGAYGRPWIFAILIQLASSVVWFAIGAFFIYFVAQMDFTNVFTAIDDKPRYVLFLAILGSCQVLDLVLLAIGCRFFKPSEVRRYA